MARATDLARDGEGNILKKTYTIPFRPEYVLVEGPPGRAWNDYVPLPQATGRNVRGFKFHLSPEAIALIMQQDPNVSPVSGYCSLSIEFDSATSEPAVIKATRAVRADEMAKS